MIGPTDCILIMGQRNCGKSYLCKKIQNLWPKRVILDSLGEYEGRESETCHSFHEFTQKLTEFKSLNLQEFTLIYQFDPESPVSQTEFDQIMRVCYYFGNIQIVIEEIQLYSSPHSLPHWLKQNLLIGRHQNLSLIFTSQRPGEVNKTIISQCSHIFVGKIVEGNDLNYLKSILGQQIQRLTTIEKRKFLYYSEAGIQEISNEFKIKT